METEFSRLWILVSFAILFLALHVPIFVPCFIKGGKKKKKHISKMETEEQPFYFQN